MSTTFHIRRGTCEVTEQTLSIQQLQPGNHATYSVVQRQDVAMVVGRRTAGPLHAGQFQIHLKDQTVPPVVLHLPSSGSSVPVGALPTTAKTASAAAMFEAARSALQEHGWLSDTCTICGTRLSVIGMDCPVCASNRVGPQGREGWVDGMDMRCIVDASGMTLRANRKWTQHAGPLALRLGALGIVGFSALMAPAIQANYSTFWALAFFFTITAATVAAALAIDQWALRRGKDVLIPRNAVQRITVQESLTSGRYHHYVVHYLRDGRPEERLLILLAGAFVNGELTRTDVLFRRNAWLCAKCVKCRYELLPGQIRCSECGCSQDAARCIYCQYELMHGQGRCPECGALQS